MEILKCFGVNGFNLTMTEIQLFQTVQWGKLEFFQLPDWIVAEFDNLQIVVAITRFWPQFGDII